MQDIVNVIAISAKGKSRIGTKLTMGIVEQDHHDKMFVVWPELNQCRNGVAHRELVQQALWIKKNNDPDFRIVGDD